MAEPTTVPQLLQQTRLEQGLDLLTLARRAGIAKHQLGDIEAGSARSFYSLSYCRKAVDKVAQQLGVEGRVAELWQDSDWRDAAPAPSLTVAAPEIFPPEVIEDEQPVQRRPSSFVGWKFPVFGVLGIALVMAFAFNKAGVGPTLVPPGETPATVALSSPAPSPPSLSAATPTSADGPLASPAAAAAAVAPTPSLVSPAPSGLPVRPMPSQQAQLQQAPSASTATPSPMASAPVSARSDLVSTVKPVDPKASDPAFRDQVNGAMDMWIRHWKNRDAQAYADLYSADFPSLARHLSVRQERMLRAAFIEVGFSDVSMRQSGADEITVRFRQRYHSDSFQSDDVKELVWQQTPKGPKIKAERLVN